MAKGVVCPVCGSIEQSENIINVFVDIRWAYRIYELPEDKFPLIKESVKILSKYVSSGECPQDKIARLQQAIDNGNEILSTSSPMKLNVWE